MLIMSFLNMIGFGNPFGDSTLTDFSLAHSLMIVVVIVLGIVAVAIWFLVVITILVLTVELQGSDYQYHYATPTETSQYQEALETDEPWALERQRELQANKLSPPKASLTKSSYESFTFFGRIKIF